MSASTPTARTGDEQRGRPGDGHRAAPTGGSSGSCPEGLTSRLPGVVAAAPWPRPALPHSEPIVRPVKSSAWTWMPPYSRDWPAWSDAS